MDPEPDPSEDDFRLTETLDGSGFQFPKEQEDIAVAVVAMRNNIVSERKLSEAIRSWTIHGSVSLLEHFVEVKLINDETRKELASKANALLAKSIQSGKIGSTGESLIARTLEAIDPSGRVSRLFGIQAAAGTGVSDSSDLRRAMHGYRLIRKIGQGGLGRVWLAFDESLKRYVAIKEIAQADSTFAEKRFQREAVIT